jgi:phage/plasmid-associated DNA primase
MILFNYRFVENSSMSHERLIDCNFKEKLNNNQVMSAFLNWLIIGAIKSYTSNLIILPKCVSDTTNEYQIEQDIYSKFIEENLEISTELDSFWCIGARELYVAFLD